MWLRPASSFSSLSSFSLSHSVKSVHRNEGLRKRSIVRGISLYGSARIILERGSGRRGGEGQVSRVRQLEVVSLDDGGRPGVVAVHGIDLSDGCLDIDVTRGEGPGRRVARRLPTPLAREISFLPTSTMPRDSIDQKRKRYIYI